MRPNFSWTYTRHLPVKVFCKDKDFRIIFTAGIGTHNACWLHLLRDNDILVCSIPYCASYEMFKLDVECLEYFNINKERIYILGNTEKQVNDARKLGMNAEFINQNAFLDYNLFNVGNKNKYYNTVYCARPIAQKNHKLCVKLKNLALILGYHDEDVDMSYLDYSYINKQFLPVSDVVDVYQQSKIGLMLSVDEGACYSSSEYLLCGLPVVSVKSNGGRDIWYDEYNSKICELNADSVTDSVQYLLDNPRDPHIIRHNHIKLMNEFRNKFIELMQQIINKYNGSGNAESIFNKNFQHKYIEYYIDPHLAYEILTGKKPTKTGMECLNE